MVGLGGSELLERDGVVRAAEGCCERALAGHGGALALLGEAGLGKTSVLDAIIAAAANRMEIACARADAIESGIAFGVARELLAGLGFEPIGENAAPYYQALNALRDRDRPLLLAVDDLHWADQDSLRLLAFLARRLADLPVALVVTLRPWPAAAAETSAELAASGHGRIERLAPLSIAACTTLLDGGPGARPESSVRERIWRLSAGNPLLMVEAARALADGRAMPDVPDAGNEAPAHTLLLGRFAGVEPDAMRCARAASVLGTVFSPDLAAELAGVGEVAVDHALEGLTRSGLLVHAGPGRAGFAHPLFAEAVYQDLTPPVRRRLHERAFRLLAARGQEEEAAVHVLLADPVGDVEARDMLLRVGLRALALGAAASAVTTLEGAAALCRPEPTAAILIGLAEAQTAVGRPDLALAAATEVLDRPELTWHDRHAALRIRGRALLLTGAVGASLAVHDDATALALAHGAPALAIEAQMDRCLTEWMLLGPGAAVQTAAGARRHVAAAGPATGERAELTWAKLALQTGDASGVERAWAIARARLGDPAARPVSSAALLYPGNPIDQLAEIAIMAERDALAEQACALVQRTTERAGAISALCSSLCLSAQLRIRQGRLSAALTDLDRGERLAEHYPGVIPYLRLTRAEVELWQGEFAAFEAHCGGAEADAPGLWYDRLTLAVLRGMRLLWTRDPGAAAAFSVAERVIEAAGIREPSAGRWAGYAVSAHLAFGRREDADRVYRWLEACAARIPSRWPRAAAALAGAELAAADGDDARAEAGYRAALAQHDGLDRPLQYVEALIAYGRHLRHARRGSAARAPLAEACARAERLQAGALRTIAEDELRRAGGRRRRTADDPAALTDAERRVAELAAAGRTNNEIAGALFISANTVHTHLRHVYAKLSVRSRRELPGVLAEL